jgi:N,N'-diacetyllegionaminate synthase
MKIGPHDLDRDVFVIAEIGNNHEGDCALAEELIRLAAAAGANAVKFQTIVPEKLVSSADVDRVRQLKRFQFSHEQFERLALVAERNGVLFLSTPFDLDSARFLERLVPAYKIASGDNNFFPLLETVARTGKPIVLSAGLMELDEVRRSKEFIEGVWRRCGVRGELAVLHCVVSYPTPPEQANLLAVRELATLGVTVGYSDHTLGIDACVLAVVLGARIVEKHFTISKTHSEFRDHQLSADPNELADLVRRVREASRLLGDGRKTPQPNEVANLQRVRRSIVAARDLEPGTILTWNDLAWVRPGGGLPPGCEAELLNRTLTRSVRRGEWLLPQDCRVAVRKAG